jgi:hypothetical protein
LSGARAAFDEGLQRARDMPLAYGEAGLLHAHAALDEQDGDFAAAARNRSAALAIFER